MNIIYIFVIPLLFLLCVSCEKSSSTNNSSDNVIWPNETWSIASPAAHGFDTVILSQLLDSLQQGQFGRINSLLIVKDGYLVTEQYYNQWDFSARHPLYSATKSVLSALIGIAIDRGDIKSTEEKLIDLLPEYHGHGPNNAWKHAINIRHLLTMTPGLEWNEFYGPATTPHQDFHAALASSDPVGLILDRAVVEEPGNHFQYNSGCSLLLSKILTKSIDAPIHGYATEHLFTPIGITDFELLTFNDIGNGANGLWLKPRDMARFGLLYARGGKWRDKQIIPADWVKRSTSASVASGSDPLIWYGYHWWSVNTQNPQAKNLAPGDIFWADGADGQLILVVPRLDLVVVVTAALTAIDAPEHLPLYFTGQYILSALRPGQH